jgi:hypothetical protein
MRLETARFADYLDAATAMLRERKLALLEALQLKVACRQACRRKVTDSPTELIPTRFM